MTPNKRAIIKGLLVEQYWWAGKNVCYVDHRASRFSFEKSCELLRDGKTKEFITVD